MRSKLFLAVGLALAATAASSGTLEETPPDPVVTPVTVAADPFDWTGFYGGLSYGFGDASDNGGLTSSGTDLFGLQFGYLRDLGTVVVGGELAYVSGDFDDFTTDWDSTRLKLIGGYDGGRILPYAFIGLSEFEIDDGAGGLSDTVTIYGLGARYALGPSGKVVLGLEYLVEDKNNFADTGSDLENNDISLRIDYRF